jgi:hypothetical protein
MSLPSIAVINFTSTLNDQTVQDAIRAVNRQVLEDFVPIWGYGRQLQLHAVDFQPANPDTLAPQKVPADSAMYLVDEGSLPGALGFHDLNTRDVPVGFVFALNPNDWTVTLSHEVLELILDPTVNLFVPGPDPRNVNNIVLHTYEACDAVERLSYAIDGIAVSDFRSCTSSLRIIPSHPKPGKMPHINTCWRGQRHGVTSCFLSARPVRTHLALHHVVPHPAQAPGDGSGRTR